MGQSTSSSRSDKPGTTTTEPYRLSISALSSSKQAELLTGSKFTPSNQSNNSHQEPSNIIRRNLTQSLQSLTITQPLGSVSEAKQKQALKNVANTATPAFDFKYDHYGKLISGSHLLGSECAEITPVVAIDCEMVGVGDLCDSALARVSIVNQHGFCFYDKFVKPNFPVTDYRTTKSGVRQEDLETAPSHHLIVSEVASILRKKIVVGHSVHNDFESLELKHPSTMTRDTAIYYKALLRTKATPSLRFLAQELLKFKIQNGEHSSITDAQVTMLLYLREQQNWECSSRVDHLVLPSSTATDIKDIRIMTIFPRKDDLEQEYEFVRPIQIDTPYKHQTEYIDTMFRLLREDFMKPLREGIIQYYRWFSSRQNKYMPTNVRVYENVCVCLPSGTLETRGIQTIKIPVKQLSADLSSTSEDSRYLINGSLLLFIPNGSRAIKVATVIRSWEEDDRQLKNGLLRVEFVKDGPSWTVSNTTTFTVLESVAFFEAYRYALESLQGLDMQNWPMSKYLLNPSLSIGTILEDVSWCDFSTVLANSKENEDVRRAGFPTAKQLGLSQGQFEAFYLALTKELAIIQGPPGTGKTFMALKIIQFFLRNPSLLNGKPILLVSNTNHSLDHVLEKVILHVRETADKKKCHPDNLVLRLGGRSKSELVAAVSLRTKDQGIKDKRYAKDELSRATIKLASIEALTSAKIEEVGDFAGVLSVVRRAQVWLNQPSVIFIGLENKSNQKPELDRDLELEKKIFEMLDIIINSIEAENLSQAKKACARLQRTPYVLLLVKALKSKVEADHKTLEDMQHFLPRGQTLRAAKAIGVTVCGMVKHKALILDKVKPAMIILEEAAHVIEATVVAGLTEFCRRLILIGDHQQLRPSTADHDLTVANHLDVSMMERFVSTADAIGVKNWTQLDVQRRMRAEISKLICPAIYSELRDDPSVLKFPDVKGMTKNLYFVEHDARDAKAENSTSFVNVQEADFLFNLFLYLIGQGNKPEKITMITTYLGQKFELEKRLRQTKYFDQIRVCCVDGFQGEENDIILLSLVRSNDERNVGFLKTDNRVCVALSRARHGLYIVGNMQGLTARSKTWAKINQTLISGNNIGPKLRLKCEFHDTTTSVGMHESHKQLKMHKYGQRLKCLCELKSNGVPIVSGISKVTSISSQTTPVVNLLKQSLPISPSEWPLLQPPQTVPAVLKKVTEYKSVDVAKGQPPAFIKLLESTNKSMETNGNGKPLRTSEEKKLSCGHLGNLKKGHSNKCEEKCSRRCNGGHKCPGTHACFQYCAKLVKCEITASVVCPNCKANIVGMCSKLFPYYGRTSKLYGTSHKMICDNCK